MKRLTYISKASPELSSSEIRQIEQLSVENNRRDQITGVLLYLSGLFFQVLEGEEDNLDKLFAKISQDKRHTDVLCLKMENFITDRRFPDWAMKIINLDKNTDVLMQPIKVLLQTVAESYRIVERYTQPSVINILNRGQNPLTVSPRTVDKIIFFSDIVAFSTFTEILPVAEVVKLVNSYFTLCTRIICAHEGEVTKFIGDCVMASFPRKQADAAICASLEIFSELQTCRDQTEVTNPLHFLYNGIGLSYGKVIEGNIGSSLKMDYTLLGDTVNVAARLQALTRSLPYSLAMTEKVKACCNQTHWSFIHLGPHQAKGRQELIEVYSIEEEVTRKSREVTQLAELIRLNFSRQGQI